MEPRSPGGGGTPAYLPVAEHSACMCTRLLPIRSAAGAHAGAARLVRHARTCRFHIRTMRWQRRMSPTLAKKSSSVMARRRAACIANHSSRHQ